MQASVSSRAARRASSSRAPAAARNGKSKPLLFWPQSPHGRLPLVAAADIRPAEPRTPYLTPARIGDHAEIYQTLLAAMQAPSREEFQAAQDDPLYEPTDRLIVKRGERVLSHVHVTKRTMQFGAVRLPVACLNALATLPEFRGQSFASQLVRAAHGQMLEDRAVLGLLRTRIPHFFRRFGWAVCGRHSHAAAKPRDILAQISRDGWLRRGRDYAIRFWRHVELPALMRIYSQNTQFAHGSLDRGENYWRWLISRRAYDQIVVALDGPDKLELNEKLAPIVGYAVLRGRRVVELLTAPGHPTAGPRLLARACGDLIEHDDRPVTVHVPPDDPLHRVVRAAGGMTHAHESDEGEVFMVKLLDVPRFLKLISPELLRRARQRRVPRPCELGLLVDGQRQQLTLTTRGLHSSTGKLGRNYLTLNGCELARLFLGHVEPSEAALQGRLEPSTKAALDLASVLFPRLPTWRPVWDDLPA